jgi:general secretion pathway protein A
MYLEHYKLAEQPFGVTPDPRYLYLSPTHREAMASVFYGVSVNRGFTALVAKPGMGKTTILFDLLRKLKSSDRTVFLFQSQCGPRGLLRALLADLGIEDDGKDFLRMNSKLNEFLLRESNEGRRLIVVIDEAQNLSEPVLEVVRMLSNFETSREKLMHIILSGQPQLAEKLSSPGLIQLRQRISIIARLEPFDVEQTRHYVNHRLSVAGYEENSSLFTDKAITLIARHSEGIPRTINNLCFNALSLGYAMKQQRIDEKVILEVLNDLDLSNLGDHAPTASPDFQAAPARLLPPPAMAAAPAETTPTMSRSSLRRAMIFAGMAALLIWPAFRVSLYAKRMLSEHSPSPATQTSVQLPVPSPIPGQLSNEKLTVSSTPQAPATTGSPIENLPVATRESESPNNKIVPVRSASTPIVASIPFERVRISQDQTLFGIVILRYGEYNPEIIRQIVEMNPQLSSPDHIKSGQILRMPKIPKTVRTPAIVSSGISNSAANEVTQQ